MSITRPSTCPRSRTSRLHEKAIRKDSFVLARFIESYCRANHGGREIRPVTAGGMLAPLISGVNPALCPACRDLFLHGAAKRALCPHDPKPRCKKCISPCYRSGYREAMRAVMRRSGSRMILRGRLDLLFKYFF